MSSVNSGFNKATADKFVLYSKKLHYQPHSGKLNQIHTGWARSARNGKVKERERFAPKVEKRLFCARIYK